MEEQTKEQEETPVATCRIPDFMSALRRAIAYIPGLQLTFLSLYGIAVWNYSLFKLLFHPTRFAVKNAFIKLYPKAS